MFKFFITIYLAYLLDITCAILIIGSFMSIWWFCIRFTSLLWNEWEEAYGFTGAFGEEMTMLWPIRLIVLIFLASISIIVFSPPAQKLKQYLIHRKDLEKDKRIKKGWDR